MVDRRLLLTLATPLRPDHVSAFGLLKLNPVREQIANTTILLVSNVQVSFRSDFIVILNLFSHVPCI